MIRRDSLPIAPAGRKQFRHPGRRVWCGVAGWERFSKGVYALRFRLRWGPRWTVPRLSRGQVGALGPSAPTLPWFGRGQGHAHLRSSRSGARFRRMSVHLVLKARC